MSDKVVLIRPENIYKYNNYPPLNLISIGTMLKHAGFTVKIINCAFEHDCLKTLRSELRGALFAGVTLLTSEVPHAYNIIRFIKEKIKIPVVVGGSHCTLFPEQMAACDLVDYVVKGEGEQHILNIANGIKNGGIDVTKILEAEKLDIETFPIPDYDVDDRIEQFITTYLTDKLSAYAKQPMRWLPYESSRGCPSKCTFCINVVTNNRHYRKKSAEKVADEIEHLVQKYKLSHLKIVDDNFFVDIRRVREICQRILSKKINITWDAECRCDYFNETMLNDETLALCRKSGLLQLTLGIESGSPNTLRIMKKGITPEHAEHAVMKCDQHKIIARSSFIIEIPGENLDDIKKTICFINKLRRHRYFTCGVGTFRPYPKCELTQQLLREKLLEEPRTFAEWTQADAVKMYTSAEYVRPWQVDGRYSESAAYYLNMESSVRLGNHQIQSKLDRLINSGFVFIARLRNKKMYYGIPVDKFLYKKFLEKFYDRRQHFERAGEYPLSTVVNKR